MRHHPDHYDELDQPAVARLVQQALVDKGQDIGTSGRKHNGVDGKFKRRSYNALRHIAPRDRLDILREARAKFHHSHVEQPPKQQEEIGQKAPPQGHPIAPPAAAAPIAQQGYDPNKPTVIADAGHGGLVWNEKQKKWLPDTGAIGIYNGKQIFEADVNWTMAKDFAEAASDKLNVVPTKPTEYVDVHDRDKNGSAAPMAERRTAVAKDAKAVVAFHVDVRNWKDKKGHEHLGHPGTQVYYNVHMPASKLLAEKVASAVHGKAVGNEKLAMLKREYNPNGRPAILVEVADINNQKDMKRVMIGDERKKFVKTIAETTASVLDSPELKEAMKKAPTPDRVAAKIPGLNG